MICYSIDVQLTRSNLEKMKIDTEALPDRIGLYIHMPTSIFCILADRASIAKMLFGGASHE